MSSRRSRGLRHEVRQNWKFGIGLVVLSVLVAVGAGIATQGLDTMLSRASLAFKAMDNPASLNATEKEEVKKLIKDKGSARKTYEAMTPEQKEAAKRQFSNLSDDQKKMYRDMFNK